MNKKFLTFGILGLFAIALISAGAYYTIFSATFTVTPAISVGGSLSQDLAEVVGGEKTLGEEITLTNNGDSAMDVLITDDSGDNVSVNYVGTLELTKKTVDFDSDNWAVLNDKVQIEYTVVGDEFSAEVTEDLKNEEGYVLVYYADNDERFANPGQAVLVEDVSENLPGVNDANANLNDYSAEYPETPFGAKIWYVPFNALTEDNGAYNINWNRADEFYFESSLIQYNAEGQITVYPTEVLDFTPEYTPSKYLNDTVTVTTTIA